MPQEVIRIDGLGKFYRLGLIGSGTLHEDLSSWWARVRGKPDPLLKIGLENQADRKGGQIWALKDIDLSVKEGEIVGIIGRNGAGKSTLLKILSSITAPTNGTAKIRGRVGSLLEVGTGFHPELTGKENIYLNGAILGMTKLEVSSKLEEIIEFAEVKQFADTPVKRYSSGMRVRLAFAVAAHLEPEILIVDEVLAVGDANFQKKCLGKMSDVASQGRTILFVSHNMPAIENLCSRCLVLDKGKVVFSGSTENAIKHYLSINSAAYTQNLESRKDRKGAGKLMFTAVEFLDDKGEKATALMNNKPCVIRLRFRTSESRLKNVNVAIGIDDSMGRRVVLLDSDLVGDKFDLMAGKRLSVNFELESLPLNQGQYTVTIFTSSNREVQDWIQEAAKIEITAGDFFKTGRIPHETQGTFILDHRVVLSDS